MWKGLIGKKKSLIAGLKKKEEKRIEKEEYFLIN